MYLRQKKSLHNIYTYRITDNIPKTGFNLSASVISRLSDRWSWVQASHSSEPHYNNHNSLGSRSPMKPRKDDKLIEIPQNLLDNLLLFDEWFSKIVYDFFHFSGKETHVREYAIIGYRFGLNGRSVLTLDETGIIYDVSRERIRQIEKIALDNLSELINEGVNTGRRIKLNNELFERIQEYQKSLSKLNKVVSEFTIANHTAEYFSEVNINLPLLRLLLTLLGFDKINLETGIPDNCFAWALEPINIKRVEKAMLAMFNFLGEIAVAKPFDEIKLAINRNRGAKSRFNDSELNLAIDLSNDIEKLDDGTIQLRYARLRSIADKTYRILHNSGEPMRSRQLAIVLNREAFKYGEKSRITPHHIGNRLSNDVRFTSIGRNGGWILSEWQNYSTENVLDLMEDSLHAVGEPLSSKSIYDFVIARRPVEETAITSYLSYDRRFVRVGTDLFALTDWGMTSVVSPRSSSVRVFSKAKLCEYIELVFLSNEMNEIFVTDLAQEISTLEPSVSPQAIYNSIIKSPAVKILNQQDGKRKRKLAIFEPNYRSQLTKLEILTKDIPVRKLIQNTVRRILEDQPEQQLELVTIRNLVSTETHCPPASVYSAIENMDDVEKEKNDSNQIVCRLKTSTKIYDEQVSMIDDKKMVTEINRALSLVNIESIDLALFQLGKIFEYTLKRYMQEIQKKNLLPVTSNDMKKLFNMVQWAGKNDVIIDNTALQYLRIERNDRGHGAPPEKDERQALLSNAPTLIQFYLDYIVLLEKRRAKI